MKDSRKARISVAYLESMLVNLRYLNQDGNDAWVQETFGFSKRQAFENMFAGIERTMRESLGHCGKKEPKKTCSGVENLYDNLRDEEPDRGDAL